MVDAAPSNTFPHPLPLTSPLTHRLSRHRQRILCKLRHSHRPPTCPEPAAQLSTTHRFSPRAAERYSWSKVSTEPREPFLLPALDGAEQHLKQVSAAAAVPGMHTQRHRARQVSSDHDPHSGISKCFIITSLNVHSSV